MLSCSIYMLLFTVNSMNLDRTTCFQHGFAEKSTCLLQRLPRSVEVAEEGTMKGTAERNAFPKAMTTETTKMSPNQVIGNALGHEAATIDISGRSRATEVDAGVAMEEEVEMTAPRHPNDKEYRSDHEGSAVKSTGIVASEYASNEDEDHLVETDNTLDRSEVTSTGPMSAQGLSSAEEDSENAKVQSGAFTAVAVMLLSLVALVMAVFYLANYPDENIQDGTCTLLRSTVALFCAVLIFTIIKDMMEMLPLLDNNLQTPKAFLLVLNLIRLVAALIISRWATKASASIGSHLSGFAAVEAFGKLQRYAFAHSWQHGMATVIGSAIGLLVISFTFMQMVRAVVSQPSQGLMEACKHSGVDSIGLTLGLVVALTVHHAISGVVPLIGHWEMESSSRQNEFHLLSIAAFIGLLMIASNFWMNHAREGTRVERIARSTQGILSMATGWCLLSWGEWLSWLDSSSASREEVVQMPAIMTLLLSALILASILAYDCLSLQSFSEPIGVRAVAVTAAVLLGLAWEVVCLLAAESVSSWFVGASMRMMMTDVGVTVLLWGWCCQLGYCVSYLHDSYA